MQVVKVTNKIPKRVSLLTRRINRDLIELMADSMDEMRKRAVKEYIIPNTQGRERRITILRKRQPTHPSKLTSRTRALEKMLLKGADRGSWRFGYKTARNRSGAMYNIIKTKELGVAGVDIQGKMSAVITDVNQYSKSRFMTKQKLIARFFWDKSGIRGVRRPFITPASKQERSLLVNKIRSRMNTWK